MKTCIVRTFLTLALFAGAAAPVAAADALKDLVNILSLRESKKDAEVAFACESYLNAHPKSAADATVRFYLAKALYDQKEHKDAIEAVDELLARHPKTELLEAAVMMRGEARRLTSKWANAIPDFRQAEELAAQHKGANAPHALYHVIQGLNFLKKHDEAEKELARLKKEYPKSTYIRSATSLLARNKKTDTAKKTSPTKRGLAAGTAAPDVEFVLLADDSKKKISDFRGKVLVVDFWASWCGPCQTPMAKMQTYREKHAEWGDKVELIALSIDNTKAAAVRHLKSKGWDKTYNVWAGDGGFRAEAPTAYGIRGIPTVYIIDQEGKIARTGHPNSIDIPKLVDELLAKAR